MTEAPPPIPPASPVVEGEGRQQKRGWFGGIVLAPLWLASVVLLSVAAAAVAGYLLLRQPPVVETMAAAPAAAEPPPETVRRAEALRALNRALEEQLQALRDAVAHPQCPPGTTTDGSAG